MVHFKDHMARKYCNYQYQLNARYTDFHPIVDVDECSTPVNTCRYACKNLVGTFMCICPEGYKDIGRDQCRGRYIRLC